jgi:hypothetical protein
MFFAMKLLSLGFGGSARTSVLTGAISVSGTLGFSSITECFIGMIYDITADNGRLNVSLDMWGFSASFCLATSVSLGLMIKLVLPLWGIWFLTAHDLTV